MLPPSAAPRRLRQYGPIALLLAAVALTSAPRFDNGPVWDDKFLIDLAASLAGEGDPLRAFRHSTLGLVHEDEKRESRDGLDLYRPLALLSFWAGYALGGSGPGPQHAINLALHLACTLLVFALARARGATYEQGAALLAAAWFGLSPALVEAHVWISGRFDLTCALFALLSLWAWRAAVSRSGRRRAALMIAASAAFLAALLCKEVALFALLALPFWPAEPRSLRARLWDCAPLLPAAALYLALRVSVLGPDAGAGAGADAILTAGARMGAVVADAVTSLLLPLRVYSRLPKEDYDALGAGGLFACFALVLALAYAAFRVRRTAPWCGFGLLWLCALLVPVAVVTVSTWPGFGRYLYLPSALFLIGCADAALLAHERLRSSAARIALRVALAVQLVSLAAASNAYAYDFRDDDTLFLAIIAAAPERSHGYGFLGITYLERRRYREAAVLLRKAVSIAPAERRWLSKLGHALLFSGDVEGARALARDAVQKLGHAPEFHLLEAYTWLERDPERAARALLECLREDPSHDEGLEAYDFLRARHPRAELYRTVIDRVAREPRYAGLRPVLAAASGVP